jgi:hypothetical protein
MPLELSDVHRKALSESLSPECIAAMGAWTARGAELGEILGIGADDADAAFPDNGGLVIPNFARDGEVNGHEIRVHEPGHAREFYWPRHRPRRLYFPRSCSRDAFGDVTQPLYLVAGVAHAVALASRGYVAIAGHGLFHWHDATQARRGDLLLHQDFRGVALEERDVRILWPGWVVRNDLNAIRHEARLARSLLDVGARVRIGRLPFPTQGLPNEREMPVPSGPDDYLAQRPDLEQVPHHYADPLLCFAGAGKRDTFALLDDMAFLASLWFAPRADFDSVAAAVFERSGVPRGDLVCRKNIFAPWVHQGRTFWHPDCLPPLSVPPSDFDSEDDGVFPDAEANA